MRLFPRPPAPIRPGRKTPTRRLLFLDDDPARAQVFLTENPEAVWVQTVADCVARLRESWDEVHLDHDLGGENFVDPHRDDCGMEVVRWLCKAPRPHLKKTRFHVHSHNTLAAMTMALQMMMSGYAVSVRPFGAPAPVPGAASARGRVSALRLWLRRVFGFEDDDDAAAHLDSPVAEQTTSKPSEIHRPTAPIPPPPP